MAAPELDIIPLKLVNLKSQIQTRSRIYNVMRLRANSKVIGKIITIGLGFGVGLNGFNVLPAQAQISDQQVNALVEALRQAAPRTGQANDSLYSDWQVQAENIPRWSEFCIDRQLSPTEFEADAATARQVITCIVRDLLIEEYDQSNGDESVAVLRSAAWWMTGDPNRYNSEATQNYTQQVLGFYQQQLGNPSSSPTNSGNSTNPAPTTSAAPNATSGTLPVYDRYMQAGYAATNQRDYETALLYFQRALDERPNDTYAQEAIENVERYQREQNQNQGDQNQSEQNQNEQNQNQPNQINQLPPEAPNSDATDETAPKLNPLTAPLVQE